MAGHERHRANSGSNNVNQEHDHHDVILEGLGPHQIEEHMECLEASGHEALYQEMEMSFGYDCCKQCDLGVTDSYGMIKKWCYYVPPIYDEEQEDYEGLHQEVGCYDATTHDFCGHLVACHDLALFMLLLSKLLVMMLMVRIGESTLLIMIVAISVVMKLLIHMVRLK
jgi:hypothetical protein